MAVDRFMNFLICRNYKKFNIMKIFDIFEKIWFMFKIPLVIIAIGVIVGLITQNGFIGFFTICGLILGLFLFLAGRQLWWFITKTGDYDKKNT
jgi:hypothetical protein